ncbi:chondroitin sulfate synthase 2 [Tribolium castaneum]|uniref:Hexosyltransferase n=1 Tax=Tribolium castaneum TaxID=7070 RepID=A0A139WGD2_TRICA|nr:PREDICTED: chondroitin sulfate synthase 2 [Tribolium castaneum]KYB26915.1 Chondroitin sulfate synthase 2-like Protein [Tribolium castaneum]|eukprot:XP_008194994.1 PREDICTED: chondroitin sulfate synthase 2 [Tribolium castaneum]
MFKSVSRLISNNFYVFLGLIIGLYISSFLSDSLEPLCASKNNLKVPQDVVSNKVTPVAPSTKSSASKKAKLVRPRYYSTELGIREKLFVGIFSSEEKVNSQVVHLNKTISHLVDQIKFFITAQYKLKSRFNLSGLVGFTDTRARYRPFQVLKYIGDNFPQDYDYYFLANDYTFINAHRLTDLVKKISVSMDVYLGDPAPDSSYCNLASGIVLSNSVIKAMREHLDWCVINAISDDHSENLGRCVHHSIGLTCQKTLQGQSFHTFKLRHFELERHLLQLAEKPEFNQAITVHPILQGDSFYLLNAYFLKQRLVQIKHEIDVLSEDLDEVWPPGQRPGAKPATRFDLPRQLYFNMSHVFFPDDFTNVRAHTMAELGDIENVIEEVTVKVHSESPKRFQFRRLINGYRSFDLSRGMDYALDLGFRDLTTGREVVKRFEVCKPLGKVELLPVPYVTENSRVTIILPVQETELEAIMDFLHGYTNTIMDRKEKTFLMLVLLYQPNSSNKGTSDVFYDVKTYATKVTSKYKNEDVKIAWVSVRLPWPTATDSKVMGFAVVDLALRKIGPESLVLVLDPYTNISSDFLNRVRMNTIANFQIFSPIPFKQYDPKVSQVPTLEINKNNGHFDRDDYTYVSFYGKDYIAARKQHQKKLPLIRIDNDLSQVLRDEFKDFTDSIFGMFVEFGGELHALRATEMGLKVKYRSGRGFSGSSAQLGRLILSRIDEIL